MTVSLIKTYVPTSDTGAVAHLFRGAPAPSPAAMPTRQVTHKVKPVPTMTRHARCADKGMCQGPGCKVTTGKTARKGA